MQALRTAFLVGTSMLAVAVGADAQRGSARIPAAYIPRAGQCRVWVKGLVAARQPAPTDCATARAHLRPNSRLVYGTALRPYGARDGYDPRIDNRDQDVWSGREDDGRWDKDRREHDREMRKRERERDREWRKSRRHGDDDEDDDEDDDDHDDDRRGNRDRDVYDGRAGRDGRNDQDPWWGRGQGSGRRECVDRNHTGVCEPQQGGIGGRVRIP